MQTGMLTTSGLLATECELCELTNRKHFIIFLVLILFGFELSKFRFREIKFTSHTHYHGYV